MTLKEPVAPVAWVVSVVLLALASLHEVRAQTGAATVAGEKRSATIEATVGYLPARWPENYNPPSGLALGIAVLRQWPRREAGLAIEWLPEIQLLDDEGPSEAFVAALAGIDRRVTPAARLEVLLEVGAHYVHDIASGIVGNPVCSGGRNDAVLPYAGLRTGFSLRVRGERHLVVGAWFIGRVDVGRYDYRCSVSTGSSFDVRVGGSTLGGMLRAGLQFP